MIKTKLFALLIALLSLVFFLTCSVVQTNAQDWELNHEEFVQKLPYMTSDEKLAQLRQAMGNLLYSARNLINLLDNPQLKKKTQQAIKCGDKAIHILESLNKTTQENKGLANLLKYSETTRQIEYTIKENTRKAEELAKDMRFKHQTLKAHIQKTCESKNISQAQQAVTQASMILGKISSDVSQIATLKDISYKAVLEYSKNKQTLLKLKNQSGQIIKAWENNQKEFMDAFGDQIKAGEYFYKIRLKTLDLVRLYNHSFSRINKILWTSGKSNEISIQGILDDIEANTPADSAPHAKLRAFLILHKHEFKKARQLMSSIFNAESQTDFYGAIKYHAWPKAPPPKQLQNIRTISKMQESLQDLETIHSGVTNSLKRSRKSIDQALGCLAKLENRQKALAKLKCPKNAEPYWSKNRETPQCRCKKGWIFNYDKTACLPLGYCKELYQRYKHGLKTGDQKKVKASLNLLRMKKCPNLALLKKTVIAPDLVRLKLDKAIEVLKSLDLKYELSSAGQATEKRNAKKVQAQSPPAGKNVQAGSLIRLVVFEAWNQARAKAMANEKCQKKYQGSIANWNEAQEKFTCTCSGQTAWNKNKTACVRSTANAQAKCHSLYPGSSAVWNHQNKTYRCVCSNGRRWNKNRTECLFSKQEADQACQRKIPNTIAKFIPQKDRYECFCSQDRIWQPNQKKCSQSKAEAQKACARRYSGSHARYSPKHYDYLCFCPDGYTWNNAKTGCVQTAQSAQNFCSRQYPGTNARWVKDLSTYRCFCPDNQKWDTKNKKCFRNTTVLSTAANSRCAQLAKAYLNKVNAFKASGGMGPTYELWNILNQAYGCPFRDQEARSLKCLDLARQFDQAFGMLNYNNQSSGIAVRNILTQAGQNGCSWVYQAKARFDQWLVNSADNSLGNIFKKDDFRVKNVPKVYIPKYPKKGNLGGK